MSHGSGKMHDSAKLSEVKPRFAPSDAVCFHSKSSEDTCLSEHVRQFLLKQEVEEGATDKWLE